MPSSRCSWEEAQSSPPARSSSREPMSTRSIISPPSSRSSSNTRDAHSAIDGRGFRAFGSAQHPIALSAAFVLLLPISLYLVQKSGTPTMVARRGAPAHRNPCDDVAHQHHHAPCRWSRLRLAPAPRDEAALACGHPCPRRHPLRLAGNIGTIKQSFFPTGGLVAQQTANPGYTGQGRLADVGSRACEVVTGSGLRAGYGTRVIGHPWTDGQILDDQWLGTLLETGMPGAVGWLWLMVLCIRRFARAARADRSSRGWLMTALAAAVAAFAAGCSSTTRSRSSR